MASEATEGRSFHDTASSNLPGRLSSGVALTNISPLTDRRTLCASPALEHVAHGLSKFGYQVGWDNGAFQVSPASMSLRPSDAPLSTTVDSFLGGLTRKREVYGYRPKVASSVTFTRSGSGALRPSDVRPTTSHGHSSTAPTSPAGSTSPMPHQPSSSPGSVRFSRMAQSVDSLQHLQVPVNSSNLNASNLQALHSPGTLKGTRPGTAPGPSIEQLHGTRMRNAPEAAGPGLASEAGVAAQPPGTSHGRPATAHVDLNKDASAALRPSCTAASAASHGTVMPSRSGARPGSRGGLPNPFKAFKPTRGHALVVFQHMDKDKNGKVTLSELEEAALALGFSLEQANRLFSRLDRDGKGYVHVLDWGIKEMNKVVELFSLAYMQRFLGLPGPTSRPEEVAKYLYNQELKSVRSIAAAIDTARVNAVTRGAHSATSSGNVIFEAFRFIDADNSGRLSYDELRDGFFALGVFVQDDVMRAMMNHVVLDNNGQVDYHEFVRTFFPSIGKSRPC